VPTTGFHKRLSIALSMNVEGSSWNKADVVQAAAGITLKAGRSVSTHIVLSTQYLA
jgi:hypothetical protein